MKHFKAVLFSALFSSVLSTPITNSDSPSTYAAHNEVDHGVAKTFLTGNSNVEGARNPMKALPDIEKRQASPGHFPQIKQYVTTHDAKTGKAVFSKAIPEDIDVSSSPLSSMSMTHLWTTESFPVDFKDDADVKIEQRNRGSFFGEGLVNSKGSVLRIVDFGPKGLVPPLMHRTVSLDYGVVLEGQMEMTLDSGERRVVNRGDVVIQRGTMHAWSNPSPDQWARVLFVLQASRPVAIAGRTLGEATGLIPGLEVPF